MEGTTDNHDPATLPGQAASAPDTPVAPVAPAPAEEPAPVKAAEQAVTAAPSPEAVAAPSAPLPPAAWGTAPPRRKSRAPMILAIVLVVVFVLGAGGGIGAYFVNDNLSRTYSPQQAVLNYFAAQRAGDAQGVMADANLIRGDGGLDEFFNKAALTAMLSIPQNRQFQPVRVLSVSAVDSTTSKVSIQTVWAGNLYQHTYTVHKNTGDPHFVFYNSWKVDVEPVTITLQLPNQPGTLTMDGLPVPIQGKSVQAISGFHHITMAQTPFYDSTTELADGSAGDASVAFAGKLSATAMSGAVAAIKKEESNCDASKSQSCPGHTYHSPGNPNYIYFLTNLPGHSEIDYNYYVFNDSSDITQGMQLFVLADQNQAQASGKCYVTMTVDGSRTYKFSGTWVADITWTGTTYTAALYRDCLAAAA